VQAALDVGGHQVLTCNTNSNPLAQGGCFEGNLDIQYIMGMAQVTTSTYYYVPAQGDVFVSVPSSDCNFYMIFVVTLVILLP
jgi:hypothetical protein